MRALVAAVAAVLLVAGCGGDEETADMPLGSSRRTAAFVRSRRCRADTTASSRSSASLSSIARSASRVTRKTWEERMSVPGNRTWAWAAITCSTGIRWPGAPHGMKRGKSGGTQRVALPEGYLDELDDDRPPEEEVGEAEDDDPGGG